MTTKIDPMLCGHENVKFIDPQWIKTGSETGDEMRVCQCIDCDEFVTRVRQENAPEDDPINQGQEP